MKNKMTIINADFNEIEKKLLISAGEEFSISELKPMEQMLVDSDNLSFIYITDRNDEYTYVAIPDTFWPEVKKAHEMNAPVYLINRMEQLLLPGFNDELSYLIENIKGNSNYGEEMVKKVESTF
ncbi:hypothetical protein BGM26_00565 [Bacillus sp. FJAT-29790]|uniref:UPF0738 family protein n=1 Tax=Bacillus sp. FJAT-29790 TaxID=1895002 RepID=UPI001C241131|nr:hypothetical protein [Bacillus sp. FJAT-29790]MBU8877479.1 hypothetical protein [Bacillus sp. FJAT-29790]